ncbi:unnamed protein product [Vitrella brassicaformis CCMP3155]|uniref:Cadherin-like beta-sandwich-like domain-containing protein n=1 Tax=Vitrella brassicaformis (strain CCMP3155) TaxID=1169540 RepID=A0A0G4FFF8_VITBC|nr:unnamed protein product [Vitrella brassicaformis CCMP3155]|eukprot:CEM11596.1 unnamed protein product [Vitrella brassicaformis CCMP3155]
MQWPSRWLLGALIALCLSAALADFDADEVIGQCQKVVKEGGVAFRFECPDSVSSIKVRLSSDDTVIDIYGNRQPMEFSLAVPAVQGAMVPVFACKDPADRDTCTEYFIIASTLPGTTAALQDLSVAASVTALEPPFDPAVFEYKCTMYYGKTTLVEAKASNGAMVSFHGYDQSRKYTSLYEYTPPPRESHPVLTAYVVSESGNERAEYHITIDIIPSIDPTLGSITSDPPGSLSPKFSPHHKSYHLFLPWGSSSATITFTPRADSTMPVKVNGEAASGGTAYVKVDPDKPPKTLIIETQAQNGEYKDKYYVTVSNPVEANTYLEELTVFGEMGPVQLSRVFESTRLSGYQATFPTPNKLFAIKAIPQDKEATVRVKHEKLTDEGEMMSGYHKLDLGEVDTVRVEVTASDNLHVRTYYVDCYRFALWYQTKKFTDTLSMIVAYTASAMSIFSGSAFLSTAKFLHFLSLTASMNGIPESYIDYTETFNKFNLQFALPPWMVRLVHQATGESLEGGAETGQGVSSGQQNEQRMKQNQAANQAAKNGTQKYVGISERRALLRHTPPTTEAVIKVEAAEDVADPFDVQGYDAAELRRRFNEEVDYLSDQTVFWPVGRVYDDIKYEPALEPDRFRVVARKVLMDKWTQVVQEYEHNRELGKYSNANGTISEAALPDLILQLNAHSAAMKARAARKAEEEAERLQKQLKYVCNLVMVSVTLPLMFLVYYLFIWRPFMRKPDGAPNDAAWQGLRPWPVLLFVLDFMLVSYGQATAQILFAKGSDTINVAGLEIKPAALSGVAGVGLLIYPVAYILWSAWLLLRLSKDVVFQEEIRMYVDREVKFLRAYFPPPINDPLNIIKGIFTKDIRNLVPITNAAVKDTEDPDAKRLKFAQGLRDLCVNPEDVDAEELPEMRENKGASQPLLKQEGIDHDKERNKWKNIRLDWNKKRRELGVDLDEEVFLSECMKERGHLFREYKTANVGCKRLNLRNAYDREMEFRVDIQLGHLYPLSTGGGDLTYYVPVDMMQMEHTNKYGLMFAKARQGAFGFFAVTRLNMLLATIFIFSWHDSDGFDQIFIFCLLNIIITLAQIVPAVENARDAMEKNHDKAHKWTREGKEPGDFLCKYKAEEDKEEKYYWVKQVTYKPDQTAYCQPKKLKYSLVPCLDAHRGELQPDGKVKEITGPATTYSAEALRRTYAKMENLRAYQVDQIKKELKAIREFEKNNPEILLPEYPGEKTDVSCMAMTKVKAIEFDNMCDNDSYCQEPKKIQEMVDKIDKRNYESLQDWEKFTFRCGKAWDSVFDRPMFKGFPACLLHEFFWGPVFTGVLMILTLLFLLLAHQRMMTVDPPLATFYCILTTVAAMIIMNFQAASHQLKEIKEYMITIVQSADDIKVFIYDQTQLIWKWMLSACFFLTCNECGRHDPSAIPEPETASVTIPLENKVRKIGLYVNELGIFMEGELEWSDATKEKLGLKTKPDRLRYEMCKSMSVWGRAVQRTRWREVLPIQVPLEKFIESDSITQLVATIHIVNHDDRTCESNYKEYSYQDSVLSLFADKKLTPPLGKIDLGTHEGQPIKHSFLFSAEMEAKGLFAQVWEVISTTVRDVLCRTCKNLQGEEVPEQSEDWIPCFIVKALSESEGTYIVQPDFAAMAERYKTRSSTFKRLTTKASRASLSESMSPSDLRKETEGTINLKSLPTADDKEGNTKLLDLIKKRADFLAAEEKKWEIWAAAAKKCHELSQLPTMNETHMQTLERILGEVRETVRTKFDDLKKPKREEGGEGEELAEPIVISEIEYLKLDKYLKYAFETLQPDENKEIYDRMRKDKFIPFKVHISDLRKEGNRQKQMEAWEAEVKDFLVNEVGASLSTSDGVLDAKGRPKSRYAAVKDLIMERLEEVVNRPENQTMKQFKCSLHFVADARDIRRRKRELPARWGPDPLLPHQGAVALYEFDKRSGKPLLDNPTWFICMLQFSATHVKVMIPNPVTMIGVIDTKTGKELKHYADEDKADRPDDNGRKQRFIKRKILHIRLRRFGLLGAIGAGKAKQNKVADNSTAIKSHQMLLDEMDHWLYLIKADETKEDQIDWYDEEGDGEDSARGKGASKMRDGQKSNQIMLRDSRNNAELEYDFLFKETELDAKKFRETREPETDPYTKHLMMLRMTGDKYALWETLIKAAHMHKPDEFIHGYQGRVIGHPNPRKADIYLRHDKDATQVYYEYQEGKDIIADESRMLGKYVGAFSHHRYHGRGILMDRDESPLYEGEWANGKRWGKGIFVFRDARGLPREYRGEFSNDQMCGKGQLRIINVDDPARKLRGQADEKLIIDQYKGKFAPAEPGFEAGLPKPRDASLPDELEDEVALKAEEDRRRALAKARKDEDALVELSPASARTLGARTDADLQIAYVMTKEGMDEWLPHKEKWRPMHENFQNSCTDTEATIRFLDGSAYDGPVQNGVPDTTVATQVRGQAAKGTFVCQHPEYGFRYEGGWKDFKPHGYGELVRKVKVGTQTADLRYKGEFKDGLRHGKGVLEIGQLADGGKTFRSPVLFDIKGEWQNDLLECREARITIAPSMEQTFPFKSYVGPCSRGMIGNDRDSGTMVFFDDKTYKGPFSKGLRHTAEGQEGELTDKNGTKIYKGKWEKDIPAAGDVSSLDCGDGYTYTGPLLNGKRSGAKGELFKGSERIYEGAWKDDLPDGKGKLFLKEGVYDGNFQGGKRHGTGKFVYKDGKVGDGAAAKFQSSPAVKDKLGKQRFYDGEWKNDVQHGEGTYLDEFGKEGTYRLDNGSFGTPDQRADDYCCGFYPSCKCACCGKKLPSDFLPHALPNTPVNRTSKPLTPTKPVDDKASFEVFVSSGQVDGQPLFKYYEDAPLDVRGVSTRLADEHPILELKETTKSFHLTDKQPLKG